MKNLSIPDTDITKIKELLSESDINFKKLLSMLDENMSSDFKEAESYLKNRTTYTDLIISLFITLINSNLNIEEYIDALFETYNDLADKPANKSLFYKRFKLLFTQHNKFELVLKVANLKGEYEKLLYSNRILTDVRPVFSTTDDSQIVGNFIMHQLRLSYLEDGIEKEVFVTLNKKDLLKFRADIDRAINKQENLETIFSNKLL